MKNDRDIEKGYSVKQMVAKLRRLADGFLFFSCKEQPLITFYRQFAIVFSLLQLVKTSCVTDIKRTILYLI
jgi:hypothetical protein